MMRSYAYDGPYQQWLATMPSDFCFHDTHLVLERFEPDDESAFFSLEWGNDEDGIPVHWRIFDSPDALGFRAYLLFNSVLPLCRGAEGHMDPNDEEINVSFRSGKEEEAFQLLQEWLQRFSKRNVDGTPHYVLESVGGRLLVRRRVIEEEREFQYRSDEYGNTMNRLQHVSEYVDNIRTRKTQAKSTPPYRDLENSKAKEVLMELEKKLSKIEGFSFPYVVRGDDSNPTVHFWFREKFFFSVEGLNLTNTQLSMESPNSFVFRLFIEHLDRIVERSEEHLSECL